MYYAIEIIGTGKKRRYTIKRVTGTGTNPTDGRIYRTEEAARDAARSMGYQIAKIGSYYEII